MPDTGFDNLFVVTLVALLAPLVVANLAEQHDGRNGIMTVRIDVGTDDNVFTYRSLDWKSAAVDLRLDRFDHDAL